MRRGRRDATRRVLERLAVNQVDDMEGTLNHMAMTIQVEERMAQNASFAQCFRGVDRRRTLIALGSFTVTQLVGVSFVLGYCTYFFQREYPFVRSSLQSRASKSKTRSSSALGSLVLGSSGTLARGSSATGMAAELPMSLVPLP